MLKSNKPMRENSKFMAFNLQRAVVWCETAFRYKPNGLSRAMWKEIYFEYTGTEKSTSLKNASVSDFSRTLRGCNSTKPGGTAGLLNLLFLSQQKVLIHLRDRNFFVSRFAGKIYFKGEFYYVRKKHTLQNLS